jgi:hypothetical protein
MDPEKKPAADGQPPQERRIPNTDMQPEDAGTSRSGNEDDDPRAAAESATKQTSKTDTESGGKSR